MAYRRSRGQWPVRGSGQRPAPGASTEPETCGGRHSESLGPEDPGTEKGHQNALPWSGVLVTVCLKPASPLGLHTRSVERDRERADTRRWHFGVGSQIIVVMNSPSNELNDSHVSAPPCLGGDWGWGDDPAHEGPVPSLIQNAG